MSEDSYNLIKNLQNQDLTGNERFNVNVQNKNSGENVEEKPKDENENQLQNYGIMLKIC